MSSAVQRFSSFLLLGSVGYIGLVILTVGSFLLPGLLLGFIWFVYLIVRLLWDAVRFIRTRSPEARTPLVLNLAFLVIAIVAVVYGQTQLNRLEYQVACLKMGHHTELYSNVFPKIVARGQEAVPSIIESAERALHGEDEFVRMHTMTNASFCLGCIGGPDAEQFLGDVVRQQPPPKDWLELQWYKDVCFAFARCAGPKAVNDFVAMFDKLSHDEERDRRWVPLTALAATGDKRGVLFVLEHMDQLLDYAETTSDGTAAKVIQVTVDRLVFGSDRQALVGIPVFRDTLLVGDTRFVDDPDNYASQFFWTDTTEKQLRSTQVIKAAWQKDSTSIRKRWAEWLK